MQATYHIKKSELNTGLIEKIRQLFKDEEELVITVASEKEASGDLLVKEYLELEKRFPPRRVRKDLDINAIIDEINQ
ncbi:MAG: hypothetical protein KKG00_13720 [Bacteroidetes bacterium]|nr:hypothetical protein [Bacteroidota bacterium]